jgi:NTE family protein
MAEKFNGFALALSGGGARGIMHAGFLKALDEEGLMPEAIAGASMGAIVGAMYAAGVKPNDMLKAIKLPEFRNLHTWIGLKGGFGSLAQLHKQLEKYILIDKIEKLPIPFFVSVTNLNKGENEIISKGNIYDAVVASASIPILFVPTKIGKYYYVDGGVTNNLPASCLVKAGRMLIGLSSNHTEEMDKEFTSMLAVGERCMRIVVHSKVMEQARFCDMLIDPIELHRYGTFDFDEADEIFAIGYKTGKAHMGEIINKLER